MNAATINKPTSNLEEGGFRTGASSIGVVVGDADNSVGKMIEGVTSVGINVDVGDGKASGVDVAGAG